MDWIDGIIIGEIGTPDFKTLTPKARQWFRRAVLREAIEESERIIDQIISNEELKQWEEYNESLKSQLQKEQ